VLSVLYEPFCIHFLSPELSAFSGTLTQLNGISPPVDPSLSLERHLSVLCTVTKHIWVCVSVMYLKYPTRRFLTARLRFCFPQDGVIKSDVQPQTFDVQVTVHHVKFLY